MKQSYEEYRFSMTEIFKYMVQSFLLCGALDYLFYQNLWLMFLALPVTVFFLKWKNMDRKTLKKPHKLTHKLTLFHFFHFIMSFPYYGHFN